MQNENRKVNIIEKKIINEILQAIHQINFGEVVVTIHNSKVVQIEKKEKKRFST